MLQIKTLVKSNENLRIEIKINKLKSQTQKLKKKVLCFVKKTSEREKGFHKISLGQKSTNLKTIYYKLSLLHHLL